MKLRETDIDTAGVYRCCMTVTKEELEQEFEVGGVRNCQHCGRQFLLQDDPEIGAVWESTDTYVKLDGRTG